MKVGVEEGMREDKIRANSCKLAFFFGGVCLGSIEYLLYKTNKMKENTVKTAVSSVVDIPVTWRIEIYIL